MGFLSNVVDKVKDVGGDFIKGSTKFLFGDEGDFDIKPTSTLTPEQDAALRQLLSYLTSSDLSSLEGTPYEGELIAQLGDNEQLLQEVLGDTIQATSGITQDIVDQLSPLLSGEASNFDDFFNQTVQQPLLETFDEDILPRLSKRFAATDPFGTDATKAVSRAGDDLIDALSRERARTGFQARESALDRSLQAGDLLSSLGARGAAGLGGLQELAAVPRGVEQAGLQAEFEEFLRTKVSEKDKRIEQILQALGLGARENIVKNQPSTSGFLSDFLTSKGGSALTSKGIESLF